MQVKRASKTRSATIAGLCLALVAPIAIPILHESSVQTSNRIVLLGLGYDWLIAILLVVLVLYWEKLPLGSIGLVRLHLKDVGLGVSGFFVGIVSFAAMKPLAEAFGFGTAAAGIGKLSSLPISVTVLAALTAGVTEEVLFRGYAIERLTALVGNARAGAVIAYVLFVGLHAPFWGVGGSLQIAAWSMVVTALYLWKRRLWPCIVMHLLNDLFALLVPILIANSASASG